jgi:ubiquinone/menaquinone biosynthesis C-methylase UbiE
MDFIWGLEPNEGMRSKALPNISASPIEVKWLGLPSEQIPLADNAADTVLFTYTLCSIDGWLQALGEMRRVLNPRALCCFASMV